MLLGCTHLQGHPNLVCVLEKESSYAYLSLVWLGQDSEFSDPVPWTAPRLPGFCSGPELLILFWDGEGGELGSGLGGGEGGAEGDA